MQSTSKNSKPKATKPIIRNQAEREIFDAALAAHDGDIDAAYIEVGKYQTNNSGVNGTRAKSPTKANPDQSGNTPASKSGTPNSGFDPSRFKAGLATLADPLPEVEADREAIGQFIDRARPVGPLLLLRIDPKEGGKARGTTFQMPDRREQAIDWAEKYNAQGFGIYWVPNLAEAIDKKPAKGDMVAAAFAWVDLDPNTSKGYAAGRKMLLGKTYKMLLASDPAPSIIVDSGNGLQAFWQFMPEQDGGFMPAGAVCEAVNTALMLRWGGDASTINMDRVMRLPGTWNYPNAAKLKRGYPATPSLARALHVSPNCYFLAAFAQEVLGAGKVPDNTLPEKTPQRARKGLPGASARVIETTEAMTAAWARSERDARWACAVLIAAQQQGTPSAYTDDHPSWIRIGQALHHCSAGHPDALDLWIEFSRHFPKFTEGYPEGEMRASWPSFKRDLGPGYEPVTIGTPLKWAGLAHIGLPPAAARQVPRPGTEISAAQRAAFKSFIFQE